MADEIELSIQGDIAFVRLRRSDRGNALRGQMFDQLRKLGIRLTDAPPRFVVLSGEGADFCAGLETDIADPLYQQLEPLVRNRDAYAIQELVGRMRGAMEIFGRLPCPVLAAIEGRCHGAGLELALIADLRIAAQGATFRLAETRLGLLPGFGGLTRLSVMVGTARTADISLTGRTVQVDEALALGLIARAAPPGSALTVTLDVVHELRRAAPVARLQSLLAVRAMQHRMCQDLYEHENQAAARTWIGHEWVTALAAVKDGHEPTW